MKDHSFKSAPSNFLNTKFQPEIKIFKFQTEIALIVFFG